MSLSKVLHPEKEFRSEQELYLSLNLICTVLYVVYGSNIFNQKNIWKIGRLLKTIPTVRHQCVTKATKATNPAITREKQVEYTQSTSSRGVEHNFELYSEKYGSQNSSITAITDGFSNDSDGHVEQEYIVQHSGGKSQQKGHDIDTLLRSKELKFLDCDSGNSDKSMQAGINKIVIQVTPSPHCNEAPSPQQAQVMYIPKQKERPQLSQSMVALQKMLQQQDTHKLPNLPTFSLDEEKTKILGFLKAKLSENAQCFLIDKDRLIKEFKLNWNEVMKCLFKEIGAIKEFTNLELYCILRNSDKSRLFMDYYMVTPDVFIKAIAASKGGRLRQSILHPDDCRLMLCIPVTEEEYLGRKADIEEIEQYFNQLRYHMWNNLTNFL